VGHQDIVSLFSLNTSSGIPIYRQLMDQIKQAIRLKLLSPGAQLPSVRVLSSSLQVNPMTISKAFAQLELEGVLVRKRGVGMLVAEQDQAPLDEALQQALLDFLHQARKQNLSDQDILSLVQQYLTLERSA